MRLNVLALMLMCGTALAQSVTPPLRKNDSPAQLPADSDEALPGCEVALALTVDTSGHVAQARVVTPCHPLLDAAATQAALGLLFSPALANGRPVPAEVAESYHFDAVEKHRGPLPARLNIQLRARGMRTPLADALVFVDGAAVPLEPDTRGRLSVPLAAGPHRFLVQAPAHESRTFAEMLGAGDSVEVVYALTPLRAHPYESTVREERARIEVSRITLSGPEVHELAGTQGDPLRAVMTLPGVASVASGISLPVVRGTTPAATGSYLDGIQVPELYHLLIGPAVFHPDFVEGFSFYPGLPPISDGRRTGGAIEANAAAPRDDRTHGNVYFDFINAGALVEVPFGEEGPRVTLAGRVSYTGLLTPLVYSIVSGGQAKDVRIRSEFYDYQARIEQKVGAGKLRLLAFGSSDVVGNDPVSPDDTGLHLLSIFHRADLRYRVPVAGGDLEVGVTAGAHTAGLETKVGADSAGDLLASNLELRGRASYRHLLASNLALTVGADVQRIGVRTSGASLDMPPGVESREQALFLAPAREGLLAGVYAQLEAQLAGFTLVPAVRLDSYHATPGIEYLALDPRLSVRRGLGHDVTLKAGAGLFHQAPTILVELPMSEIGGLAAGLQSGAQMELGAEWRPRELPFEVDVQAFYNPLFRAVEYDPQGLIGSALRGSEHRAVPATRGAAYGAELLLRKRMGQHWLGWVSYTLSRSERLEPFDRYDDSGAVLGSTRAWVPFTFDQTHVLNAAASYQFAHGFTAGLVFHFNTGRPESGVLTSRGLRPAVTQDGEPTWVFADLDRVRRLPAFYRMDVRLAKTWTRDNYLLELYLDVLDVTGASETYGYRYGIGSQASSTERTRTDSSAPIVVPMLGLKGSY